MDEQQKALIRAYNAQYARQWRQKNPDKVKAYMEKHYLKKAMEAQQEWNAAFRGEIKNEGE